MTAAPCGSIELTNTLSVPQNRHALAGNAYMPLLPFPGVVLFPSGLYECDLPAS